LSSHASFGSSQAGCGRRPPDCQASSSTQLPARRPWPRPSAALPLLLVAAVLFPRYAAMPCFSSVLDRSVCSERAPRPSTFGPLHGKRLLPPLAVADITLAGWPMQNSNLSQQVLPASTLHSRCCDELAGALSSQTPLLISNLQVLEAMIADAAAVGMQDVGETATECLSAVVLGFFSVSSNCSRSCT